MLLEICILIVVSFIGGVIGSFLAGVLRTLWDYFMWFMWW